MVQAAATASIQVNEEIRIRDGVNGLLSGTRGAFGTSMTELVDADWDGVWSEMLVTAEQSGSGTVFLLWLTTNGTVGSMLDLRAEGPLAESPAGKLGSSIAWLGDLDGDGRATEFAVGAYDARDAFGGKTGVVTIFSTAADGRVAWATPLGNGLGGVPPGSVPEDSRFGYSVARMRAASGAPMLAVGAEKDPALTGSTTGAVYLLRLRGDGTASSVTKLAPGLGGVPAGEWGRNEWAANDVEYVEQPDAATGTPWRYLLMGKHADDRATSDVGAVYVFRLSEDDECESFHRLSDGEGGIPGGTLQRGGFWGTEINALDVEGDGTTELLVAARQDGEAASKAGALYLHWLDSAMMVTRTVKLTAGLAGVSSVHFQANTEWGWGSVATPDPRGTAGFPTLVAGTTRSDGGMIFLRLDPATAFGALRVAHRAVPCARLTAASAPPGFDPRELLLRLRPDERVSLPAGVSPDPLSSCLAMVMPASSAAARDAGAALQAWVGDARCVDATWGPAWRWEGVPWVVCQGLPGGRPGTVADARVDVAATASTPSSSFSGPRAAEFGSLADAARLTGRSLLLGSHPLLTAPPPGSARFATAVSRVGDVDGNGLYDEVVIGARADLPGNASGVYVVWLDAAGSMRAHTVWDAESTRLVRRTSAAPGSGLGAALCDVGDVDGDTRAAEVAVGAPLHRRNADDARSGAVFITWLSTQGDPSRMVELSRRSGGFPDASVPDGARFGAAVAFLGRDGPDTVLGVGAPGAGPGAVFVLVVSRVGSILGVQKLSNDEGGLPTSMLGAGEEFGSSLGLVRTPGADGGRDIAVGAPGASGGDGRILVLQLGPQRTVKGVDVLSPGEGALRGVPAGTASRLGAAMDACGDPDGAGFPSLVVGAPGSGAKPGGAVLLRFWETAPAGAASPLRHATVMPSAPEAASMPWLTNESGFGGALACLTAPDGRLVVAAGLPGGASPQVRFLAAGGAGPGFAGGVRVRASAFTASKATMLAAVTSPATPLAPGWQGYGFVRPQLDPLGTLESAECLWARVVTSQSSLALASVKLSVGGAACDETFAAPWRLGPPSVQAHSTDLVCCGVMRREAGTVLDLEARLATGAGPGGGATIVTSTPGLVQFGSQEAMSHVTAGHRILTGQGGLPGTFAFPSQLAFGSAMAWLGDVPGRPGEFLAAVGTRNRGFYVLRMGEDGIVAAAWVIDEAGGMPAGLLPAGGGPIGTVLAWAGEGDDGTTRKVLVGAPADTLTSAEGMENGALYVLRWGVAEEAVVSGVRLAPGEGGFPSDLVSEGSNIGTSVSWLGDLDGDGMPLEVAVGAPDEDVGGADYGAVVILWLTSRDTVASARLIAPGVSGLPFDAVPNRRSHFGSSLAWMGVDDVTGTGLAVGAWGVGSSRGALFLLRLDDTGEVKSSIRVASGEAGLPANTLAQGDRFGTAVAWMGDTSDGLSQLAVGVPQDDGAGSATGAVYVLHTGPTGVERVLKLLPGVAGMPESLIQTSSVWGASVAWVGDRLGSIALLVGASRDDEASGNGGAVTALRLGRPGLVERDAGANGSTTTAVLAAWPAEGNSMSGGGRVSLSGTRLSLPNSMLRLAWPSAVTVGGRPCTDVRGNAAGTQLNCTLPPGYGAGVGVRVKVGSAGWTNGTARLGFAPPRVDTARPSTGLPQAGGGILVVDGADLVPLLHFPDPPPQGGHPPANVSLFIGPFRCPQLRRVQDGSQLRCESTPRGAGRGHRVRVVLTGGQESVGTATVSFEPGRVDRIAPAWVLPRASGSMSFQVNGTGFGVRPGDVTRVDVGGNTCGSVRWVSPTSLWCDDVRAGAFSGRDAVVFVDGAPSGGGLGVLDYPPPPTVVGANRTDVPAGGGAAVTLFGSNLGTSASQIAAVLVGETACLSWRLLTENTIECVTPPGVGAALTVSVVTAGGIRGRSAIPFLAYSPPVMTFLDPSYAFSDEAVAYDVTVSGRNFGSRAADLTEASVGGVPCASVVHMGDRRFQCRGLRAPWRDRTVRVVVGGQASVASGLFDFLPPPFVDGVSPDVGTTAGGTNVTIFGAGFGVSAADVAEVTVGSRPCVSLTFVSQTELRCVVPAGVGASLPVRVQTVANGANGPSGDALFSYSPPAVLAARAGASAGGAAFAGLPSDTVEVTVRDAGSDASRLESLFVVVQGRWSSTCNGTLAVSARTASGEILRVLCPAVSFAGAPVGGAVGSAVLRVEGQDSAAGAPGARLPITGRPVVSLANPSSSPSTGRGNATAPAAVVVGERFGASGDDVLSVSVGGVACPLVVWESSTSLAVTVPPGAGLGRRVVVVTRAGLASVDAVAVDYLAPAVAAIEPVYAFAGAARQPLVIRGSNLGSGIDDVDSVRVGGHECESVRWVSPSQLLCDASMAAFAGQGQASTEAAVTVTVGGQPQTVAGVLSVVARPAVAVLNPDTVPTRGGNVTVVGSGFGRSPPDVLSVSFGGAESPRVAWVSPTELVAEVPPGAGAGLAVRVTTRGGLSSTLSTRSLDYRKAEVLRLDPTYAMTGRLTAAFVVHGTDFGNGIDEVTGVLVGGNPCGETEFVSDTVLACRGVNASKWHDNSVTVTVGGQEGLRNSYFQHFGAPNVTDIAPRFAAELEPVFILGTGFGYRAQDVLSVTVDGTPCHRVVHRGPTTLSCYMPVKSAELEARAAVDRRALGDLPLVVTTSGGLRSSPVLVSYEGAGASIREVPRHIIGFRNVGAWQAVLVRFSFPEHDVTSDVVRVSAFEVELTTQLATASSAGGAANSTEARVIDVGDAEATTPTRDGVVVYLLELKVAVQAPVALRVRAVNSAGAGPWSDPTPPVPPTCRENEFLTSHLEVARWACEPCPANAFCGGAPADNVTALAGTWRVPWSPSLLGFAPCHVPAACRGYEDSWNGAGLLSNGTEGPSPTPASGGGAAANASAANTTEVRAAGGGSIVDGGQDSLADLLAGGSGTQLAALSAVLDSTRPTTARPREEWGASSSQEGCADGYWGTMCTSCRPGFTRWGVYECRECADAATVLSLSVVVVLVVFTGVCVLVLNALRANSKGVKVEVAALKIVFSHLQTVAIAAAFDLQWPELAMTLFSAMSSATSVSSDMLSIDCILEIAASAAGRPGAAAPVPVPRDSAFLARSVVMLAVPIVLLALAGAFWGCLLPACECCCSGVERTSTVARTAASSAATRVRRASMAVRTSSRSLSGGGKSGARASVLQPVAGGNAILAKPGRSPLGLGLRSPTPSSESSDGEGDGHDRPTVRIGEPPARAIGGADAAAGSAPAPGTPAGQSDDGQGPSARRGGGPAGSAVAGGGSIPPRRGTLLPSELRSNPLHSRPDGKAAASQPPPAVARNGPSSPVTPASQPARGWRAGASPRQSPLRGGSGSKRLDSAPPPGTPPALHLPPISSGVSMRGDLIRANPLHPAASHIGGEIHKARFRPAPAPAASRREWCQCLSISERAIGVRLSLLDKVFVSFVITLFVVHMSVTKSSLQLLTCTTVARDVEASPAGPLTAPSSLGASAAGLPPGCPARAPAFRVAGDLELCCDDPSVQTFTLLFGVPGVVVYAVGIPIGAAWLLTLYRNRLSEPRVRATLGFLFAGYRREAYYWEAVVMLRKVLVSAIAVFLAPQGVSVQTYAVIVLIFLLAIAQAMKRPFASRTLNRLELAALTTAFFTFVAGLFQLTASSSGVKVAATLFMVAANLTFLAAAVLVVITACRRRRRVRKNVTAPVLRVLEGRSKVKTLSSGRSKRSLLLSDRRLARAPKPSRARRRQPGSES